MPITVQGDRELYARLGNWPRDLHQRLLLRIRALTGELAERVRYNAPIKTGKLRASVGTAVTDNGGTIRGSVYATADDAAALEFGIHREIRVPGYTRLQTTAWGRPIAPIEVNVDPFERLANIEARLWMRGAFQTFERTAAEEIEKTVDDVARDVSA